MTVAYESFYYFDINKQIMSSPPHDDTANKQTERHTCVSWRLVVPRPPAATIIC